MSRHEARGPPSKRGRMEGAPRGSRGANLREHEIEEELSKYDPNARPNNVLLFTVLNADYPIDVSIISKVCQPIGKVDRIVIFRRGYVIHAMVEFDCLDSAISAKKNLHGCDIYSGCCTLKVEYAKTDRLQVKRNDDMSWDYTDEFNRSVAGLSKERPVLLTEPPKMNMGSSGLGGMGSGGMGMASALGGLNGVGGLGMGLTGMSGGNIGMSGSGGMGGGLGSSLGGGGMAGNSFSGMASSLMGAINGGIGGMNMGNMDLGRMTANDSYGNSSGGHGGGMGKMGSSYGNSSSVNYNNRGGRGAVAMIYGLEPDKFNCQRVFNLFCQYGNIMKIMFLKTKEGCVMMEMAEPEGVQNIIENVSNTAMFGLKVRVDWSKKDYVTDVKNPHTLPDGSPSFMSFEMDRNNRFDTPERAAKNRILPATKFLHFFNVPKMDDDELEKIFTENGLPSPVRIKWFPGGSERSGSGLVEFDSIQEACEALVICNHHKIEGDKFPYIMKLCFSQGPREQRRDRVRD